VTKVLGLDRLKAKLARLPKKARAALVSANLKSADLMVGLAQQAAPVKSGALRASIRKEADENGVVRVKAGGALTRVEVRKGSGAAYDYAVAVEFGTKPHKAGGKFAGAEHPGQAAQPFFYPSYRLMKRSARARAGAALRKAAAEETL
jgi:HK97 gp10 family phage protein